MVLDVRFRPHECKQTAELFRRGCDLDPRQQKTRVAARREGVRNDFLRCLLLHRPGPVEDDFLRVRLVSA